MLFAVKLSTVKIHVQNVTGKTTWLLLIGVKMHVKQIASYLKQMRAMMAIFHFKYCNNCDLFGQLSTVKIHVQNVTGKTTWLLLIGVKMHVKQIAGYLKQMRAMMAIFHFKYCNNCDLFGAYHDFQSIPVSTSTHYGR